MITVFTLVGLGGAYVIADGNAWGVLVIGVVLLLAVLLIPKINPYALTVTVLLLAGILWARMIETAWRLGGLPQYEPLGLRRWAHMLGFRGHFLTKSRRYSTTFTALRAQRQDWRLVEDLAQLGHDPDPTSVVVINDWRLVGIGHRDEAERELAHAIAERNRQQRRTGTERSRS